MLSSSTIDPWYVYIVRCADQTLYTGTAKDLATRVQKHNSGKGAKYTRSHGPVELLYSEKCENRSHACKREAKIKKLSRHEKEKLILSADTVLTEHVFE